MSLRQYEKTRLRWLLKMEQETYVLIKESSTKVDFPTNDIVIGVSYTYAIELNLEQLKDAYIKIGRLLKELGEIPK